MYICIYKNIIIVAYSAEPFSFSCGVSREIVRGGGPYMEIECASVSLLNPVFATSVLLPFVFLLLLIWLQN